MPDWADLIPKALIVFFLITGIAYVLVALTLLVGS